MAGKPRKSSVPGVSIQQRVEEIPEGCSTPDFKQKPVTLALQEGKNAIFRAVVCGEPMPEVHWQSTRGALSNCSKYQISSAPGSREHALQINKLTGEDSDLYRCTAVNAYGEATCSVRLTVIEVGFRKNQKRQKEPQEDLRKELMDFRKMLKKRAPPPAPEKKMAAEQVWQLLMTADRKDYEKICMKYGVVDFRGMLRKLQEMKKEREDKMAQYVNAISNLRHIRVTKEGVATFDLELDLKDLENKIYLYKDGEMIPCGFDNQTKHCLRRLGKRYHFQIQDLHPEDAGLYQVMVEDSVVFSTELEASAIPPRVVVPLAEARCEEQGDAVFECTLSNPCSTATWHFQHRPLKLSDKYEVSVSPDGLTHRLVVRGAGCSDMGLYSLNTGLYSSSAWLVVEGGKDKGPQTTDVDHQLQPSEALASDAEDSGGISGKGGQPREQNSLEGTRLTGGTQLIVGPDNDGFGGHGYPLMGDGRDADSAWCPGQDNKGFVEVGQGSVGSQLHRDRAWDGRHSGRSHLQGEGPEAELGFTERRQQSHGREGDGYRSWGTTGSWEAGSSHPQAGRQGREPREGDGSELDGHGQRQLRDPHLRAGTGQKMLWGSWFDAEQYQLKGEGIETPQGNHAGEMEGRDGPSRERSRGPAKAAGASGAHLGEARGGNGAESLGIPALPRGSSSPEAGMSPESWDSQGGRDADHREAGESGDYLGQTSASSDTQKPSLSGSRKLLLGCKRPETKTKDSLQGVGGQGVGERRYKTGPERSGDVKNWEGGLQEHQGRDGQGTSGALGRTEGSRSLQSPQSWTVGQRRAGGSGRTESENTGPQDDAWSSLRKTETHFGSGVLVSGGREGGVGGSHSTGPMEPSQRVDDKNLRLITSPGLGSGGTPGEMEGLRDPGTIESEPDFWTRSGSSRGKESRAEMEYKDGLRGLGWVESGRGESLGHSEGMNSRDGAAYHDGSGMPEEIGSGHGTCYRATSGAPVETESTEGGTYRHGSGVPRGMWSGNKGQYGPVGRESGRVASLNNVSGGRHGMPMDEAWFGDVCRSHGQTGPRGEYCSDGGLGSPGTVESVGRGGLKTPGAVETTGEGHAEAEPGSSGKMRSWDQAGDYGGFRAPGALGTFGEGGGSVDGAGVPGSVEPGSQGPRSREDNGDGIRFLGTRASGAGTRNWDNARHSKALAPYAETGSESHRNHGSGNAVDYRDEFKIPESWGSGDRKAYGEGSRGLGPERTWPEGEVDFRHGSGNLRGMGPAGEANYKNDIGGSGVMGSKCEIDYGNDIGGSEIMRLRGEAGYTKDMESSGVRESGGKAGYGNSLGTSRTIPLGSEKACRSGLEHSGVILSKNGAGFKDGFGGTRTVSESEVGHKGDSGCSGEMGKMCYAGDSGQLGGLGSPAELRDHRTMGPRSGYQAAGEEGTRAKDGTEKGGGIRLANGAETGVNSAVAGMLATTGDIAHKDSSMGPAKLGAQGVIQIFSGGQSTKNSLGGYGLPLGTVGSMGKSGVRQWQDGSGIPGSPGNRGVHKREGKSADQTGAVGTSRILVGRGTVEGENWAGIAALESGHDRNFNKTDSGTADRGRVVGQGAMAPQGDRDSLPEGRRNETSSGSLSGADQIVDSSSKPGGHVKSMSGPNSGQEVNHTWASGWKDQGQGSSRASSSLEEKDVTFRQTYEGTGSSRLRGHATGQEAAGECQGTFSLESRSSGLRRGRAGHTEDSSVLDKGNSTGLGDGVISKPGASGPLGMQNGLDSLLSRKGYSGGSGGIQDPGSHLGTGQGRESGSLREWVSLEVETDKAQVSRASKKYERRGKEDFNLSDRKSGPCGNQSGTEFGSAKRGATEKVRSLEHWTDREDRKCLGDYWGEDGSRSPRGHLSSRRVTKESSMDICGQRQDATQSPRFRHKPGTGSSSTEDRGPIGQFSQNLADKEVQLGETAILCCTLTSDLGPGTWFKDGVKLTAQDGVIFEQDGLTHRLILTHVDGTQAGRYTFVAGSQHSEASLTVQDPPTIAPDVTEKLGKPVAVKAGKPVTVKIPFQSRLPVQAAWRKDGDEVVGSSHKGAQMTLGDGYTRLCLPSVGRKDSGQYSVTLRNEGGCVQAEFTLQVIDKPEPPQGPLEVQDCRRAGVCLNWRPPRDSGGQVVEYYVVERRQANRSTWLKVGEPPPDSTSFTDASVEEGRKYAFRVRAVTSEGAGDALESEEVLVAPEALPGPPSAPAILSSSSQSITITWVAPPGPGSAHILGYLVEKRKKGSHSWMAVNKQPMPERRCTVVDVRQGCQYEFRITAVAPSGPGEPGPPSDAVFARDPMRPPGSVRDLQVTDTSNTSITLSWIEPDTQDGDEAQGYIVELCASGSLQWSPCHMDTVPGTTFTAKGLRSQEGYFVRVTAVNDGGRGQPTALDSLIHAMPVTVCPKFLMDSSTKDSLMVRVGDSIRVPVSFEAVPMPEVTWLKDGLPLPKRSVTTMKDGLTQLLIPAARLSDCGRYTVVLRGLQGKEAAYSFLLSVAACPQAPGSICLQETVPGTVTVQWEPSPDEDQGIPLHYTVLIRSSSHSTWHEVADHIHTNRFTLLGVLSGHEYHFRVVAKNELGASEPSDTSQPWYIPRQQDRFTVKAPTYQEPNLSQKPRFLVGLRAHLLPQGCECRMTCAVQGSPPPRVTWFKNDQSLDRNPALYSTDMLGVCSLVIPSVSPEDSGEYKAVAENSLGRAVSRATLIVIESSS